MKHDIAKPNYILRFDTHEIAEKNENMFPVKKSYEKGDFTIRLIKLTTNEWKLYKIIIEVIRQKKVYIDIQNW